MRAVTLQLRALHTDATRMPYQDLAVPGKIASGQMWTLIGDRDHAFNIFRFPPDHSGGLIKDTLANYEGFLSADAHNIYDSLFHKVGKAGEKAVLEVGCWAHCRRNFYDARGNDATRAHEALARIRRLYAIEAEAKLLITERKLQGPDADAAVLALRQEKSRLEAAAIHQWLQREVPLVLSKSLIGQAIQYALNHWIALTRFLDHGFLAIDNNVAENALRANRPRTKKLVVCRKPPGRPHRRHDVHPDVHLPTSRHRRLRLPTRPDNSPQRHASPRRRHAPRLAPRPLATAAPTRTFRPSLTVTPPPPETASTSRHPQSCRQTHGHSCHAQRRIRRPHRSGRGTHFTERLHHFVAQPAEERLQFVAAAVNVADEVERPNILGSQVGRRQAAERDLG